MFLDVQGNGGDSVLYFSLPGQRLQRLPFLYFLQHFFLYFLASKISHKAQDSMVGNSISRTCCSGASRNMNAILFRINLIKNKRTTFWAKQQIGAKNFTFS